jgi:hypothetical protein
MKGLEPDRIYLKLAACAQEADGQLDKCRIYIY